MHLQLFVVSVFAAISMAQQGRCPNGRRIRYAWHDLPDSEKGRWVNAVRRLHTSSDRWNQLARDHSQNSGTWHYQPQFLPVHRQYIKELERALTGIDPDVVIPYWPWSIYSNNPSSDPLWNTFSRDGDGECVTDNVLGGRDVTTPTQHCLMRGIDRSGPPVGRFTDQPTLGTLIESSSTFFSFANTLEYGAHAQVHLAVGGARGDMTFTGRSSNDPTFWLHHTYIDKIWNDWQRFRPERARMYDGPGANAADRMAPYDVTVNDVLSIDDLCYVYRQPGSRWEGPIEGQNRATSTTRVSQSTTRVQSGSSSASEPRSTSDSTSAASGHSSTASSHSSTAAGHATSTSASYMPEPTLDYDNKVHVILAPKPSPLPDYFKRAMNMSEEECTQAEKRLSDCYDRSREMIKKGEPVFLPGYDAPVPVIPKEGSYIENLDTTDADSPESDAPALIIPGLLISVVTGALTLCM